MLKHYEDNKDLSKLLKDFEITKNKFDYMKRKYPSLSVIKAKYIKTKNIDEYTHKSSKELIRELKQLEYTISKIKEEIDRRDVLSQEVEETKDKA